MNKLLKKVFEEAAKLPSREQDEFATLILEELRSEKRWTTAFKDSEGVLASLADEALAAARKGAASPLDFDHKE